nr:Ribosomal RNA methyltransferase (FmrO) [uncultured bacterium]
MEDGLKSDDVVLDRVVEAVLGGSKYRHVSRALVREIGRVELGKGRGMKEAVKAVKNKLHQVAGAYVEGGDSGSRPYERWLGELREAAGSGDGESLKGGCRRIMGSHASTRERLPILEEFYGRIFEELPPVRSVVDVACGLNPLAIPWMGLADGTGYVAYDIYEDMMGFLGGVLGIFGVEGRGETRDVVAEPSVEEVDLALVLKAIPCLEQIDRSAGRRLLDGLKAKNMVVSFPVASLGGRNKGMAANYEARFWELAEGQDWVVKKLVFRSELVFVVAREGSL